MNITAIIHDGQAECASPLLGSEADVLGLLLRLAAAIDLCDADGRSHGTRVAHVARRLALKGGYRRDFADDLFAVAALHDLGKVTIAPTILMKPGPLDGAERAIVQSHAEAGAAILSQRETPLMGMASAVALSHHERWDGAGYPYRIAGTAIPLVARLVAIADVFDALLSRRSYKEPWQPDAVHDYLAMERGRQFDPLLLDHFLADFDAMLSLRADVASFSLVH